MKAHRRVRVLFRSGGKVPLVPIVAVVIDCLIVFAFLSPFILPDKEKPVVSAQKPEPKVAGMKTDTKPKVFGQTTQQPSPPPAAQSTTAITIAAQTNPIVAPELGLIPESTAPIAQAPTTPPVTSPAEEQPSTTPTTDPPATDPPATTPNPPASFTTEITGPGQVAAGTQIGYNAAKGEKTFYGGDLILSTTSVTVSRSSLLPKAAVIVSSPDGSVINTPSSNGSPSLVMDILAAISTGTTFPMLVDTGTLANGTYTVHVTALRSNVSTDTWQYDGFLAVTVVD